MAGSFSGDLVGRVLGGRYLLLARVGSGGSARVYAAEDLRLRRRVAVKVLQPALADDPAFLRRFQTEAEALGQLTHPNIVVVLDWNDGAQTGGEPPYLVTQFLEGGSVRDLLAGGHRLSPSQALLLGLDTARALAFAHGKGFVHRDVKPDNLLLGDDGRARVTDFGLARALAEAGFTEPTGAPMGSARYLSPEQARGLDVDGRGDVYSLALTLVEAVTGALPFAADTWQGTLAARLDRSLEVPAALGPLVPVLEAAGRLDRDERIDAEDLVSGLEQAARSLPRAEPLPIEAALARARSIVADAERDPAVAAARGGSGERISERPAPMPTAPRRPTGPEQRVLGVDGPDHGAGAPFDVDLDPDEDRRSADGGSASARSGRRRSALALFVALVVLIGGGAFVLRDRFRPTHPVPALGGKTLAEVRAVLTPLGLRADVDAQRYDATVAEGAVITQRPGAGEQLREGHAVHLTMSKGPAPVAVPDLAGRTVAEATVALDRVGLVVRSTTLEASRRVPEGAVIRWSPMGSVRPGTGLALVVSSGPPTIEVPDLTGTPADAVAAAVPPGFRYTVTEGFSDTVPAGKVARTEPAAGEVVRLGTPLTVIISKGPDLVTVPDVIGRTPADAAGILRAAGLSVASTVGPPDRPVRSTSPARGTRVKRSSSITLRTS